MRVLRVAAFAAMTSLACIPSITQAATSCWYPNEARAAQIRGLQTMLMVGTLQCRRSYDASEDLYNDFINNQRPLLDANIQILKARFERENGLDEAQGAYDRFGTTLANQYSRELDDPEYCRTVHRFARLASHASREQLLELADAVAEPPESGFCRPSRYEAERSGPGDPFEDAARREPPPPPRVAISADVDRPAELAAVAAATPVAGPALAELPVAAPPEVQAAESGAPAPLPVASDATVTLAADSRSASLVAPAPVPAEAKTELIRQVKVEPAVAPSMPSRGEALQAAIVALQSAVVALQAVSGVDAGEPGPVKMVEVPAGGASR